MQSMMLLLLIPQQELLTNKINTPVEIEFENGKAYSFKLLLGMTSVKVTADVDTWPTPEEDVNVDLPKNEQLIVKSAMTDSIGYEGLKPLMAPNNIN